MAEHKLEVETYFECRKRVRKEYQEKYRKAREHYRAERVHLHKEYMEALTRCKPLKAIRRPRYKAPPRVGQEVITGYTTTEPPRPIKHIVTTEDIRLKRYIHWIY